MTLKRTFGPRTVNTGHRSGHGLGHSFGHGAMSAALAGGLLIALAGTAPLAQTPGATPIALALPAASPYIGQTERSGLEAALRAMTVSDLQLTFARLHVTFRAHIGDDDLRLARTLIDCAFLTEAELARRGYGPPEGTQSAGEMLQLYELVL